MVLVTAGVVSVPVGFFGAAVAMMAVQALTLKEAYDAVEWPVLILFGALIPVSEALQMTGATELIAGWLSTATQYLPPLGALGLMLIAAMALTPFLNNAATVLVMAPVGASLAGQLGLSVDPFLMAVAIGAGCDFLTPIGHQCNTLVMGPGGYRFGDYWRLGLPLSLIVVVLGHAADQPVLAAALIVPARWIRSVREKEEGVRLIDLSREIAHRMPVHPAHPTVAIGCWNDHDEIHRAGTTSVTSKSLHLALGDHAGTHVDAPCHFDPTQRRPRSIRCRSRTSIPRRSASTSRRCR